MGTWGVGLLSDDTAVDVYGEYMDKYNDGVDHAAIREVLEEDFADYLEDDDDGPVFWIALALAQWECGVLAPDVQERVSEPGSVREDSGTLGGVGRGDGSPARARLGALSGEGQPAERQTTPSP